MLHQRQILLGTILGALLFAVATESVQAQPGRSRGRGGVLAIDSVRDELKISDELYEKIREATRGSSFSPEMFSLASKIRSAPEAEKPALRAQMEKIQQDNAKKSQDKLKALISPAQFTRMQQLTLHRNGTRALMDPTFAAELKVNDGQREKIKAIVEEMEEKRRSNRDSNASDEERRAAAKKNSAERDKRVLALLNPEQTKAWEAKLGPAAPEGVFDGRPKNTAAPVVQNSNSGPGQTTPSTTTAAPANAGSIPLNPDGSEKPRDVVASFGVDPKKDIAKKEASVLAFNFKYAPWADVLKLFADSCGYELDIINVPPGTWDLQSSKTYTPRQALNVLNGALLQKGYIMVKRDEFLVVLSLDGGPVPPNIVPRVALEEIYNLGANELVTVIMPLSPAVVDLQAAADAIKQQVGPQGSVVALTGTNRMQITDLASVLIGIKEAWGIDDLPPGEVIFQDFKLVNVAVTDAEEIVRDLFGLPERGITNVSQSGSGGGSSRSSSQQSRGSSFGGSSRSFGGFSRGQDPRSRTTSSRGSTSSSRSTAANSANGTMSVSADLRRNALLVRAPTKQMKMIEATIKAIDVGDGNPNYVDNSKPYLNVYKVSTDATEVAKTLGVLYPRNLINEDGRNGLIHIHATTEEHRQIAIDIERLGGQTSTEIAIISLDRMNAYTATSTIQSLFFNEPDAPTVQSLPDGKGLLVRGSQTHVQQIRTVLGQMKTHLATYQNQGGTTRIQSLQGIDPYDMIEMLKAGWGDDGPNPIRVITPRNSSPIRNQLVPSSTTPVRAGDEAERSTGIPRERPQPTPTPVPGTDASASIDANIRGQVGVTRINDRNLLISGNSGPTPSRKKNGQANFSVPVENQKTDEKTDTAAGQSDEPVSKTTGENGKQATVTTKTGATIIVTPNGPDLLLVCKDEKALDEMQAMIASLASRMPVKPQWTVFYLSSSDATETATMLGRLLPSSSVTAVDSGGGGGMFAGLTSSLSGMGRGLMDATGLSNLGTGPMTLQIIPEVRSNALYVSGPPHQVREVGEYLKVLDASELPSQLRQRSPKMIPVMYADVDEIANIVRSVYKEEIEGVAAPSGGGGGANLAAMFMGGGGGGRSSRGSSGGGRAQKQIKLTIGIDSNTNQLIISSSDSLFREIDSLVYRLDEDARRANPTVTLVSLKSANARQVENALKSLMPGKINVTRSANTPSSNSRSSSGGTSSQSGARNPEQVRQFMEMRQRMLQGGGATSTGRGGFDRGSSGRGGFDRGSSGRGGTTGRGGSGGRR